MEDRIIMPAKKSFIVYNDNKEIYDSMTDEEAGKLFKTMVAYSATQEITKLPPQLKFIFLSIKKQMDRDREKYEKTSKNRAISGRLGGITKKQRKQMLANVTKTKQKPPDIDIDIDIDIDNDNDIKRERDTHARKTFSSRKNITNSVLQELSKKFDVSVEFVADCWDTAQNWLDSKGKTRKNYKAFLSNWVKRDVAYLKLKGKKHKPSKPRKIVVAPKYEEISEEQRKSNRIKMSELKEEMFGENLIDNVSKDDTPL